MGNLLDPSDGTCEIADSSACIAGAVYLMALGCPPILPWNQDVASIICRFIC